MNAYFLYFNCINIVMCTYKFQSGQVIVGPLYFYNIIAVFDCQKYYFGIFTQCFLNNINGNILITLHHIYLYQQD